jgi:ABC-type transport system substrate-binding protein
VDQLVFNLTQRGTGSGAAASPTDKPTEAARNGQIGGANPGAVAPPHPILGDVNVRKAIFHATNRNEYLDNGRSGVGTVATAPLSSELAFHADDIVLPSFNQATANQLLDAAGWDGPRTTVDAIPNIRTADVDHPTVGPGTALTIELLIGNTNFDSRIAVIDSNLAQVGVNLRRVLNTDATNLIFRHRNFDTTIINYAQGYDPHVGVRRQYHSDQVSTTSFTNAAGYKNGTVDTAFDQAVQSLDFNTRFTQYRTFQGQVAQDLPYLWLLETPNVRGFTSKCTAFKAFTGLFAEAAYCTPASP